MASSDSKGSKAHCLFPSAQLWGYPSPPMAPSFAKSHRFSLHTSSNHPLLPVPTVSPPDQAPKDSFLTISIGT